MGRALHDGAMGVPPGDRRAPADRRSAGGAPPTQATSVLARGRRSAATTRAVAQRQPRPGPARREAPAARPASAAASRRPRRGNRMLLGLLALLAIAVAIIAIVLVTAPAPTRVVLRNVVYSDVQQASAALQKLVSENTK
jgi:hypothetical protein